MDVILTGKEYTGIGLNLRMTIKFLLHLASFVAHLACNVGDLGSIPGLGRSPGKEKLRIYHHLQRVWSSGEKGKELLG